MARTIQTSDIVPTKVLLGIAERVRTVAAKIAKDKHAPLKSERAGGNKYSRLNIGISAPTITSRQTSVNLTLTDVAMAFEHGGKPHPIDARNAPLQFPYPKGKIFAGVYTYESKGQTIIKTDHVNHPGVKARPFLEPARRKTRQKNLEDISKTSLANLRLIVTGMKRVV